MEGKGEEENEKEEKDEKQAELPESSRDGASSRGGKTRCLSPQDNEISESSDSDVDSSLLIETMVKEHEMAEEDKTLDTSNWIVAMETAAPQAPLERDDDPKDVQVKNISAARRSLPFDIAGSNSDQVVEVDGDVYPDIKTMSDYVVQLPYSDYIDEIILTPPLAPEVALRFNKRNAQGRQEHIKAKAINVAQKKNLEGTTKPSCKNSFDTLYDKELMYRASCMGVNIPDNDFTNVDILRELEKCRNMEKKGDSVVQDDPGVGN